MEKFDINLFNKLLEASNKTNETLQASYDVMRKEWEQTRALLDSVVDNSNSAIIAINDKGIMFLKNLKAKELMSELGKDSILNMLITFNAVGIHEYFDEQSIRFFRLSVGMLNKTDAIGRVYVLDDITQLKKFEHEKQRDEKLRLMGEMAANIAHEIRNPLGSIELYASLLARDLEADPDKKRLTSSIVKGVRTINSIISNTLLYTKELKITPKEHVLVDIVDEVVLYLQHIIREKKVKLINLLDEELIIYCDADMLKQVVMNIIGNAVDAVKVGGEIKIQSNVDNNNTYLIIADNGSGIDDDMLSRLFMPFQTTKAKGTGLGLSIAYKIIKAHNGDIVAESNGKNYTKFVISLPRGINE